MGGTGSWTSRFFIYVYGFNILRNKPLWWHHSSWTASESRSNRIVWTAHLTAYLDMPLNMLPHFKAQNHSACQSLGLIHECITCGQGHKTTFHQDQHTSFPAFGRNPYILPWVKNMFDSYTCSITIYSSSGPFCRLLDRYCQIQGCYLLSISPMLFSA